MTFISTIFWCSSKKKIFNLFVFSVRASDIPRSGWQKNIKKLESTNFALASVKLDPVPAFIFKSFYHYHHYAYNFHKWGCEIASTVKKITLFLECATYFYFYFFFGREPFRKKRERIQVATWKESDHVCYSSKRSYVLWLRRYKLKSRLSAPNTFWCDQLDVENCESTFFFK